jgi:hypothetical protein
MVVGDERLTRSSPCAGHAWSRGSARSFERPLQLRGSTRGRRTSFRVSTFEEPRNFIAEGCETRQKPKLIAVRLSYIYEKAAQSGLNH